MTLLVLSIISLCCAVLPALLFVRNLRAYRTSPPVDVSTQCPPRVSLLIPARNEERGLRATLHAALDSERIELEVIVLDDHSTDRTAEIVCGFAAHDPRVRLELAPPLPAGWCGKQHACRVLSTLATFDTWLFLDADVRLEPSGVAQAVRFLQASGASLVSGVPRQETVTLLERLLLPLIHFVLLGFLPLDRMRRSTHPAYGAGCGQFFLTTRDAYEKSGGHAAIRESLHDGVRLPRAYRAAGLKTDLFDATPAAVCRMYRSGSEVWRGLAKNATEGLAAPAMIVPATLLLALGQIAPFLLLPICLVDGASPSAVGCSAVAVACAWLPRLLGALRFRQSWLGAVLHPLGIALFLAIQWSALFARSIGQPATWKQRSYAAANSFDRSVPRSGHVSGGTP
ncbi:glycosyltransferase [Planctellipticum variicoloris]|uniref:glycosyltransferase n=1 Tax=Planctellipticum variicoloris TaxID=3064265 RepID=UPI00301386C0|nr:glycosyltransferase [Planctomycetaceae bacterium SH412]